MRCCTKAEAGIHPCPPPTRVRRRAVVTGGILGGCLLLYQPPVLAALKCRGLNGYDLRQCLREKREASDDDIRQEYLRRRQFEQPGELVVLPNGFRYRELNSGKGKATLRSGTVCEVTYIVYRLSSGGYFKYSSGGTPIYMFSVGYGYEGKEDLDNVYTFTYGDERTLPQAASAAIEGMRVGGIRRILIPPEYGWTDKTIGPRPDTFGGYRRLESHKQEPLLLDIELQRMRSLPDGDENGDHSSVEADAASDSM